MHTKLIAVYMGACHLGILGVAMASETQRYPVEASSKKELQSLLESQYVSCRYIAAEEGERKVMAVFRNTGFGVVREDLFIYLISSEGKMTLVAMMPYSSVQAKGVRIIKGIASVVDDDGNVLLSGRLPKK